jgi:hypothetical protein
MKILIALIFAAFLSSAFAQPYQLSPNAPQDKPLPATLEQRQRLDAAIQPLMKQARASYPDAKRRFLAGLPQGETFFVTANLRDQSSVTEQVFVAVQRIDGNTISGTIASNVLLVKGYKAGDVYSLPEGEIIDWLISKPDGTEEGNLVGKFLDTYHPQ